MNRLPLFCLICLSLAAHVQAEDFVKITAGAFDVQAPVAWVKKVIVEKVPIQPVYSADDWKAFKKDPKNILKPWYACRPQHWAIRFPVLSLGGGTFDARGAGDNPTAPQILIHKADEWEAAGKDGTVEAANAVKFIKKLRDEMDTRNKEGWYGNPAYIDGSLTFVTLEKRIDFKGGHGLRRVAQWTVEADFARRGELHYLFLGFSDDNTCQIIATIPVDLPGLPAEREVEKHLGWKGKPYEQFAKDFGGYHKAVEGWLVDNASKITPSLDKLDAMMASLHAETWK